MRTSVTKKVSQKLVNGRLVNRIAIVVDASGSMFNIHNKAVETCNKLINTIKQNDDPNQDTYVSLYVFSGNYGKKVIFTNIEAKNLVNISVTSYYSSGGTPLFSTFNSVVNDLQNTLDANNENTSFLVVTITDGDDTGYNTNDVNLVKDNIRSKQATDRWTFAFQLPPNYKSRFVSNFGIPEGNVSEWEATEQGMREVETKTSGGINAYYGARNAGIKSLSTFYTPVDLANVKSKDLNKNLTDLRYKFKCFYVDKNTPDGTEYEIRDFVQEKTRKTYKIGCGYYQLVKPEFVQPNKEVLIVEKGKSEVWGGTQARDLIGLPHNANAKVDPINTSKYDVFVQSRAVNRHLPRGTKIMVDLTKNVDDVPTWDHTKV